MTADHTGDWLRLGPGLAVRFMWRPFAMQDPMHSCMGVLSLHRATDSAVHVPEFWRESGAWFVPMLDHATVWIELRSQPSTVRAVKLGMNSLNLMTGAEWRDQLIDDPQDYIVLSGRPRTSSLQGTLDTAISWMLVGFDHPEGVDLDEGKSPEPAHLRVRVFSPRSECLSDHSLCKGGKGIVDVDNPTLAESSLPLIARVDRCPLKPPADPYGMATWDLVAVYAADIYLVSSFDFRRMTGQEPPPPHIIPRLGWEDSTNRV